MRGMTPELMWTESQGWMSMADCHHCSMPLWEGEDAWRNPTVTADGWSMRIRCALCARDMAAEYFDYRRVLPAMLDACAAAPVTQEV